MYVSKRHEERNGTTLSIYQGEPSTSHYWGILIRQALLYQPITIEAFGDALPSIDQDKDQAKTTANI